MALTSAQAAGLVVSIVACVFVAAAAFFIHRRNRLHASSGHCGDIECQSKQHTQSTGTVMSSTDKSLDRHELCHDESKTSSRKHDRYLSLEHAGPTINNKPRQHYRKTSATRPTNTPTVDKDCMVTRNSTGSSSLRHAVLEAAKPHGEEGLEAKHLTEKSHNKPENEKPQEVTMPRRTYSGAWP